MKKLIQNKKLLAVIGFALLVVSSILVFVTIWNLDARNPDLTVPGYFFFLVVLQLVVFALLFNLLMHLIPAKQTTTEPKEEPSSPGYTKAETSSAPSSSSVHPTNINIDKLSDRIIPAPAGKEKVEDIAEKMLQKMAREFNFVQALLYLFNPEKEEFYTAATYAFTGDKKPEHFKLGSTLPGQAAKNRLLLKVESIPEDYQPVASALGEGKPTSLFFIPLLNGPELVGVIEAGLFRNLDESPEWALDKLSSNVAKRLSKFTHPK